MPFTATCDYYYELASTAPMAGFTIPNIANAVGSNTLSDTGDTGDDGDLAPNALVQWSAGGSAT